jgi:hypothetical protein
MDHTPPLKKNQSPVFGVANHYSGNSKIETAISWIFYKSEAFICPDDGILLRRINLHATTSNQYPLARRSTAKTAASSLTVNLIN